MSLPAREGGAILWELDWLSNLGLPGGLRTPGNFAPPPRSAFRGRLFATPRPILVKERLRRFLILLATLAACGRRRAGAHPLLSALTRVLLAGGVVALLLWLLWRAYRAFLWKVGRRLAFSYFLLGVLPIPLLLLLLAVLAYLLSGFFLGHLYRDAVQSIAGGPRRGGPGRASRPSPPTARPAAPTGGDVVFGYYRGGKKLAGDPRLPAAWPAWLELPAAAPRRGPPGAAPRFVSVPGGRPTLAAAASRDGNGVVALYSGDLDGEISRRADVWTELFRSDDPDLDTISLEIRGRKVPLHRVRKDQQAAEAARFFKRLARGERLLGPAAPLVGGDLGLPVRPLAPAGRWPTTWRPT